jgi:hypothetical protein
MSRLLKYALLVAYVDARFGQEQVPVAAIQALSDFGNAGDAATLSGQVPGVLLAAASPCDKVCLTLIAAWFCVCVGQGLILMIALPCR